MRTAAAAALPPVETLSQRQQRGMDCVWCGITLTPRTALDLGPQPLRILDHATHWYPRACVSRCGAYRALLAHTAGCPRCLDGCPTGDRLRQAEREAQR
ncbi:hypothetical protein [Streptomyces hypolithicus]